MAHGTKRLITAVGYQKQSTILSAPSSRATITYLPGVIRYKSINVVKSSRKTLQKTKRLGDKCEIRLRMKIFHKSLGLCSSGLRNPIWNLFLQLQ